MSITVNENGVLHTLDNVSVNENGVIYSLDTVTANENGVLHEIFSGKSAYPDTLGWYRPDDSEKTTVFTGLSVVDPVDGHSALRTEFGISAETTITISFYYTSVYSGHSGGVQIYCSADDGNYETNVATNNYTQANTTHTFSCVLQPGYYMIHTGSSGGGQTGSGDNYYKITVEFS